MQFKNVFLIVFAVGAAALLASNFQARSHYSQLTEEALNFRQDCNWFSMDVVAVDAETGEPVARAFLDHRTKCPDDAAAQLNFPRLSRVYSAEQDVTTVSGIANEPVRLVVCARDYKETEIEIVPDRSQPNQPTMVVKLERIFPSGSLDGLALSADID